MSAIEQYDLDGVNVDIENVTASYRDAYTKLVRMLREKLPAEKRCPSRWPPTQWVDHRWHGSYDYAALATYADYLMVMAYDESWEGSAPGPVASIDFVERSLAYALEHAPADKIVLGVPFYGRIWSADGRFNGSGIGIKTLEKMLSGLRGNHHLFGHPSVPEGRIYRKSGRSGVYRQRQTAHPRNLYRLV